MILLCVLNSSNDIFCSKQLAATNTTITAYAMVFYCLLSFAIVFNSYHNRRTRNRTWISTSSESHVEPLHHTPYLMSFYTEPVTAIRERGIEPRPIPYQRIVQSHYTIRVCSMGFCTEPASDETVLPKKDSDLR